MNYRLCTTKRFDKDYKRCMKRHYPMKKLHEALRLLTQNGCLPSSYKPHILKGNHAGEWEAHLAPDWLLTWRQDNGQLTLLMISTGTHSDIFG